MFFTLVQAGSVQAAVSYAPPVSTPVATPSAADADNPEYIARGELNGDGLIDLVTVNETDATVTVLLSDGSGGFSSVVSYATGGTAPRQVAIGDLNNDGHNDLVIPNTGSQGRAVAVLLNNGSGVFSQASESPIDFTFLGAGAVPTSPVIADFNSDTFLDVAVSSNGSSDTVQILFSDGDGTFTIGATIPVGLKPSYITTGNVNPGTDTHTDLVVAHFDATTASVYLGDGAGNFTEEASSPFEVGARPWAVHLALMDGDSVPDLVLVNYNANSTVRVYKGNNDGTFGPELSRTTVPERPHGIDILDVNNDTLLDIVVASDNDPAPPAVGATTGVSVLLGDGLGDFSSVTNYPLEGQPNGVVAVDLDGANLIDLAVGNGITGNVDVLLSVPTANPPTADAGTLSVNEDTATNGTLTGTDADGALLTFALDAGSLPGKGAVTLISAATGAYTYTPTADMTGSDSFGFTVDDGAAVSAPGTITVTIVAVNDVPVRTGGVVDNLTVAEDSGLTSLGLGALAYGPGGGTDEAVQTLSYAVTTVPAASLGDVVLADGTTVVLAGPYSLPQIQGMQFRTATDANGGPATFSFTVKDNGGTGNGGVDTLIESLTIDITAVNDPPTISGTPATTVEEGSAYSFTPTASDADVGDTLTFSITNRPTWAAFDTATGALTGTPAHANLGTTTGIVISVSDGTVVVPLPAFDLEVTALDSNNDGISDDQAAAIGLDPQLTDTDGDGITDVIEVGGAPANPVDADGDGIIDALEFAPADASILQFVVPAPTAAALSLPNLSGEQVTLSGNGAAVTANNNGTIGLPVYAESDLAVADGSFDYPFGLYDFSVVAVGGTATVTLTLPAGIVIPTNAVVRKLNVGDRWQTFTGAVIDRTVNTITLTLVDNDGVFDLDNTAGMIRDPVGVAVPVASGGGGGGCSLGAVPRRAGFDPTLLLTLASLLYLQRRRKRNAV